MGGIPVETPNCPRCGRGMVVAQERPAMALFFRCSVYRAGTNHCAGTRTMGTTGTATLRAMS